MTRIFHLSDIHFGLEDTHALAWVVECVARERPDAVAITGDLTMRARHREFAAACRWISALDVPVTVEVGNHDAQQEVLLAGHQIGFHHLRPFRHRVAEGVEFLLALALQLDRNEDAHRQSDLLLVDQRHIAAQHTGLFHQLDTPQARRGAEAHRLADGLRRHVRVALQQPEDLYVDLVHFGVLRQ